VNDKLWSVELGHGLGNLQLGLERSELLRRLEEAKIEFDADDDDLTHIHGLDADLILTLTDSDPPRLIQIAVEDERVQFATMSVMGRPLHEIVALLQVQTEETVWRTEDEPDDSLPTAPERRLKPASDDELLDGGTLWIRPLGLGLRLWLGETCEIYLRLPENVPVNGIGQLTTQQLELSQKTTGPNRQDQATQLQPSRKSCLRSLSGLICFGLIAWVIWQGALYQRRWHDAPKVEAEVIAIHPNEPDQIPTEFVVTYRDQNGIERQATLGLADLYGPKAVGEKIELYYLPEHPDRPLTHARKGDVAFIKFGPWVIGLFAGYLALQVILAILGKLFTQPKPDS
jgi:hypothetical protein